MISRLRPSTQPEDRFHLPFLSSFLLLFLLSLRFRNQRTFFSRSGREIRGEMREFVEVEKKKGREKRNGMSGARRGGKIGLAGVGRRGREEGSIGIIGWGKGSNYWDDGWPRGAAVALLSNQRSFRPSQLCVFFPLSISLSPLIVSYRLHLSFPFLSLRDFAPRDPTKRKDRPPSRRSETSTCNGMFEKTILSSYRVSRIYVGGMIARSSFHRADFVVAAESGPPNSIYRGKRGSDETKLRGKGRLDVRTSGKVAIFERNPKRTPPPLTHA